MPFRGIWHPILRGKPEFKGGEEKKIKKKLMRRFIDIVLSFLALIVLSRLQVTAIKGKKKNVRNY